MEKLKVVGQVVQIPVDRIRPNLNQGRKFFDPEKLKELAASIKSEGLEVPIEARLMDDGFYEIIKGERRWLAHKIAELGFIDGIIKEGISDEKAKRKSTVDNFGREGHTTLESMQLIEDELIRLKKDPDRTEGQKTMEVIISEIAKSFCRKQAWVYQHLRLTTLPDEVKKLLNPNLPKGKGINFSTALAITKIKDRDEQIKRAQEAIKEKLTADDVAHRSRTAAAKNGTQYGDRKRRPSDDRDVFKSFLNRTIHGIGKYTDHLQIRGAFKKMFDTCPPKEKKEIIHDLDSCYEQIGELRDLFRK